MVGELYKSSMGWAIRYPIYNQKNNFDYNTTFIPIDDESKLNDKFNGLVVPFSIKIKSKKGERGKMPYAEININ